MHQDCQGKEYSEGLSRIGGIYPQKQSAGGGDSLNSSHFLFCGSDDYIFCWCANVHVCTICSGPSAFVDSKGGSSVGPQDGGLYYLYNVGASVHRQFTFVENAERRNLP